MTENAAYFRRQGFGPAQVAYFADYPAVPRVFWTVGIVGGLAAGVLLAARSRRAAPAAVVSVVATVCLDVLTFGFRDRWSVLGWRSSSLDLVFLTVTVGLVLYSRSLVEREILR